MGDGLAGRRSNPFDLGLGFSQTTAPLFVFQTQALGVDERRTIEWGVGWYLDYFAFKIWTLAPATQVQVQVSVRIYGLLS